MDTGDARAAYFESVLIGGREEMEIRLADYDPDWPVRFAAERMRVQQALGPEALTVEHIGSTAVPGLVAKPIIDVLVTVKDIEDAASYQPAMEVAGFQLRVREAGHRMFRSAARDVHVHVYEPTHPAVDDYITLRERLRHEADDRDLYARAKHELARRQWDDMNDYADAKTTVITQILNRARRSSPERRDAPDPTL
jgi:GrpB-like predicted nucleotidyltransferase (UPF0157 family)